MKHRPGLPVFIGITIILVYSIPCLAWQKIYGGINDENAFSAEQTADGGYIAAGETYSFGAGYFDAYLVKADSSGNCVWSRTYGGAGYDTAASVAQTADMGYIFTGWTQSFGAGAYDVYLVKTDSNGDCVWAKTYGGANNDEGTSVAQTSDGGYVIGGWTGSFGNGGTDMFIIKTDSLGNSQWSNTFGGAGYEYGYSVSQTMDGGYLLTGFSNSFDSGPLNTDVYIVKTDSAGDCVWARSYNINGSDWAYSAQEISGGGYIIAGRALNAANDFLLFEIDSSGNSVWSKTYNSGPSTYNIAYSVRQTPDMGFIITGQTQNISGSDLYLIKTDSSGIVMWQRIYGGSGYEKGASVSLTSDGGYVIAGTNSSISGNQDAYMLKTDANGLDPDLYTPTVTATDTATPTVTATCVGEGSLSLSPDQAVEGSSGNTLIFTYTAGPTTWADSPGYGVLRLPIYNTYGGWETPSINPSDPGYFTVDVKGGTLVSESVIGTVIEVRVYGLPAYTGQIIITYGDKSGGGPGATAPINCPSLLAQFFIARTSPDGSLVCPIPFMNGDSIGFLCWSPTVTETACCLFTNTYTVTATATPQLSDTPTPTQTNILATEPPPCFIGMWGTDGSGDGQLGMPAPGGVAVDMDGNVYVTDTWNYRIEKFDKNGVFLSKWGSQGTGDGQFDMPNGIAIDGTGNIYVVDTNNNRIEKFDSNGNFISKWGVGGGGDGEFYYPNSLALDGSGNIYVADTQNHRVQKFDPNGVFITKWGLSPPGPAPGHFLFPFGIAADTSGNVYVADTSNHRMQKFDTNGVFISQWGVAGTDNGNFEFPWGAAVDASGNVYVCDFDNYRIQKFDPAGAFMTSWGSHGSGPGQFNHTHALAFDGDGNIYVADSENSRVQKFGVCGTPTLTITCTSTVSPTPSACCGTPTITPTMTATPAQGAALLSIKKSVSGQQPAVGAIITYEIAIINNDVNPAHNLTVWDTLPAQVEFLYNYSGMPYTKTGQYIVWDLSAQPALNPQDVLYVDFECKIIALSDGVLIANFAGCDYFDAAGKHAPIFSEQAFYPLGVPAVYPNPGVDHVRFKNIVPGSEIGIYTMSGEHVNTLAVPDTKITWDCRNSYKRRVSPGIYYYLIRDSKGKALNAGKLFIVKP